MTNREWLNTLTDQEFAEWCIIDHYYRFKQVEATLESTGEKVMIDVPEYETLREISSNNTSSLGGVLSWLKKEHI